MVFKTARRIGCLLPVLTTLAVVVGLLVAGDIFARRWATIQLTDRIAAAVPEGTGVQARIKSFPFVPRLLLNGHVDEVGAHIDRLASVHGIAFTDLDIDLQGVVLDSHELTGNRHVKVDHISQGTVSVWLTQDALTAAVGRPVRVAGGGAFVRVLGTREAQATLTVDQHTLALRVAGLPALVLPLPNLKLIPCLPALTFAEGRVGLSCTFTQVPDAFVRAASRAGGA
jgi:hypothetical protein